MGCSSVSSSVSSPVPARHYRCVLLARNDGRAETHKRWFFLDLLRLRAQFGIKFALEISEEVHRSAPRISRRKSGTQDLDVAAFFGVCFASFLARGVGIDCVLVMYQLLLLLLLLLLLSLLSLLLPIFVSFSSLRKE